MIRLPEICCTILLCVALLACNRQPPAATRHYQLTGRVVAVNARDHTATIDAAAIPNYMEAMTMDYPIPAQDDFSKLHAGDRITATVDVRDDGLYSLSHIQSRPADKK